MTQRQKTYLKFLDEAWDLCNKTKISIKKRKRRRRRKTKVVKSCVKTLFWSGQLSGSPSAVTWLFIDPIRHLASNQSPVSFPASFYNLSFHPSFLLSLHLYHNLWPFLVREEKEEVNLCTEYTHTHALTHTYAISVSYSLYQRLVWRSGLQI